MKEAQSVLIKKAKLSRNYVTSVEYFCINCTTAEVLFLPAILAHILALNGNE